MKLVNKVIVITGGTSGIGYVFAQRLHRENTVIVTGTNTTKLKEMEAKGFITYKCNLASNDEIEACALSLQNSLPHIDVLFNNAGVQFNYPFVDGISPNSKVAQEMNVNVCGQVVLTNLLLPLICSSKSGAIINTTSGLSRFPKYDGLVYSMSKAAMHSFTIGLKYFLKAHKIRVMEFIPPVTATNMTASRNETKMSPEELVDKVLPQIERERAIVTTRKMRFFLVIAALFPSLANRILNKK